MRDSLVGVVDLFVLACDCIIKLFSLFFRKRSPVKVKHHRKYWYTLLSSASCILLSCSSLLWFTKLSVILWRIRYLGTSPSGILRLFFSLFSCKSSLDFSTKFVRIYWVCCSKHEIRLHTKVDWGLQKIPSGFNLHLALKELSLGFRLDWT